MTKRRRGRKRTKMAMTGTMTTMSSRVRVFAAAAVAGRCGKNHFVCGRKGDHYMDLFVFQNISLIDICLNQNGYH